MLTFRAMQSIACLTLTATAIGCTPYHYMSEKPRTMIVITEAPVGFAFQDHDPEELGDSVATSFRFGDTVESSTARKMMGFYNDAYLVNDGSRRVWLKDRNIQTAFEYGAMLQPTVFKLPKDLDGTAWGRAVKYIKMESDMRIQTTSDVLIETYNPIDRNNIGFSVSRVPMGDSTEYTCECITRSYSSCRDDAKRLAHHIATGTLP